MHPEAIAAFIIQGCNEATQQVNAGVAAAPGIIRSALDNVRVGWPVSVPLPGWVKDQVVDLIMMAVREAARVILEAIAAFRTLAESAGRPSLLRAAAATLNANVGPVGETVSTAMVPTALLGLDDDSWDSPASTSYNTAFTEQVRAVDEVSTTSRDLASVLDDMADSLDTFFFDLQWAWIGFALTAGGLVVAVATAAPTLGVGAIVGIVLAVIGTIQAIASIVLAFTNTAGRSAGLVDDLAASPAIAWPSSAFAR